jgi:hypothetical protein
MTPIIHLSPALPDVRPAPSGGLFRFWALVSKDSAQITLRHRAFGTVAMAPSSASETPSEQAGLRGSTSPIDAV